MNDHPPTFITADITNGNSEEFERFPVARRLLRKAEEGERSPIKDLVKIELIGHWNSKSRPWESKLKCLASAATVYVEDERGACILLAGVQVDDTLQKHGLATALTGLRAGIVDVIDRRIDDVFSIQLTENGFEDFNLPFLEVCPPQRLKQLPAVVEHVARTDTVKHLILRDPHILKLNPTKASPLYRAALKAMKSATLQYTLKDGTVTEVPVQWDKLLLAKHSGLRKELCRLSKQDEPLILPVGEVASS